MNTNNPVFRSIYKQAEARIKADPTLTAFAKKHCQSLEQFISEVAKEQYKLQRRGF